MADTESTKKVENPKTTSADIHNILHGLLTNNFDSIFKSVYGIKRVGEQRKKGLLTHLDSEAPVERQQNGKLASGDVKSILHNALTQNPIVTKAEVSKEVSNERRVFTG